MKHETVYGYLLKTFSVSKLLKLVFTQFLPFLVIHGTLCPCASIHGGRRILVLKKALVFGGAPKEVLHEVRESHLDYCLEQAVDEVFPLYAKRARPDV